MAPYNAILSSCPNSLVISIARRTTQNPFSAGVAYLIQPRDDRMWIVRLFTPKLNSSLPPSPSAAYPSIPWFSQSPDLCLTSTLNLVETYLENLCTFLSTVVDAPSLREGSTPESCSFPVAATCRPAGLLCPTVPRDGPLFLDSN